MFVVRVFLTHCAGARMMIFSYLLLLALSLKFVLVRIAESPAEFFSENKNIAGFDNVSFF